MQHSALVASAVITLGIGGALAAQEEQPGQHQHSPYAGHEMSEIPSLTPDELAQLRNGEGMGFAKAAELNHFPGPRHVLDMAGELELTAEQRARTEEIFDAMLSIIVGALAEVTTIATLPPTCFWPRPKVSSTMVAITPRPNHGIDNPDDLASFTTAMFGKRRKQLGTIFGRESNWPEGVTANLRPEAISVEQIVALWRTTRKEKT